MYQKMYFSLAFLVAEHAKSSEEIMIAATTESSWTIQFPCLGALR